MSKSSIIDKGGLDRARELFQGHEVLRSRDFDAAGIGREYLRQMTERGEIIRLSRGVYATAEAALTEHHTLAICAQRVPEGVVCLLSALFFYGLGTALPWKVWLAIGLKAHKPKLDYPSLHIVRFSSMALVEGVEVHTIEGVSVKITSPARTVVDCFRYRNKVGLDVALEALRESLRPRRTAEGKALPPLCTRQEIERIAEALHAAKVMRPYLEAYSAL